MHCTKKPEIIVEMCSMIITEIFRKDYTSIKTSAWRADCISGRSYQPEVVLPVVAVSYRPENVRCGCTTAFYRMRQINNTKERCGIISHRVKNLFRFYNHCLGSCHFVGEKLHTPLANVEPPSSPSGEAGENEPKQFGLFIGEK